MVPADYKVEEDPAYITWKQRQAGRHGREGRRRQDIPIMKRWTQFTGHTLSHLVEFRKQHLASTDPQEQRWEENKLLEFMTHLRSLEVEKTRKGTMAQGTVVNHWATVASFYQYHNMEIKEKQPKSWTEIEYHPCTIADVRELYQLADVRARFVLNILTSTGLSNEDIAIMTLGTGTPSILDQLNRGKDRIVVSILRAKTKVRFRFILPPTCVEDLRAYLQYRKGKGEGLGSNSPLVIGEREGKVDYRDVYRIVSVPASQCGKDWFTPKLLRKLFNQIVKNKGLHDHAEYWMGHTLPEERAAYFRNMPEEELLKAYQQVEKDLNIKGETFTPDEKRLKLEWQLDQLRVTHPELVAEFNRMKTSLEGQGRAMDVDTALSWISSELLKKEPSGGLAWSQMSKKDKLSKVLAMLAEVMSEREDS